MFMNRLQYICHKTRPFRPVSSSTLTMKIYNNIEVSRGVIQYGWSGGMWTLKFFPNTTNANAKIQNEHPNDSQKKSQDNFGNVER